jgi:hypothetical protein
LTLLASSQPGAAAASRLRARREIAETLALDAATRGWDREVQRHRCTSQRIDKLLADLGQPHDGPCDTPENDDPLDSSLAH